MRPLPLENAPDRDWPGFETHSDTPNRGWQQHRHVTPPRIPVAPTFSFRTLVFSSILHPAWVRVVKRGRAPSNSCSNMI